jgi:phenylalanyl-tRNA synthetase alpha chain
MCHHFIIKFNYITFTGAIKSIEAHGELLSSEPTSRKVWEVTDEGNYVIEHGSHEVTVFKAIPAEGISQPDLMKVKSLINTE